MSSQQCNAKGGEAQQVLPVVPPSHATACALAMEWNALNRATRRPTSGENADAHATVMPHFPIEMVLLTLVAQPGERQDVALGLRLALLLAPPRECESFVIPLQLNWAVLPPSIDRHSIGQAAIEANDGNPKFFYTSQTPKVRQNDHILLTPFIRDHFDKSLMTSLAFRLYGMLGDLAFILPLTEKLGSDYSHLVSSFLLGACATGEICCLKPFHQQLTTLSISTNLIAPVVGGGFRYLRDAVCTAASYGHLSLLRYLLENVGIDIKEGNNRAAAGEPSTPLVSALEHPEVVRYLLCSDVDVNQKTEHHCTPIQMAVSKMNADIGIIKVLLEYGADIAQGDWHSGSALERAKLRRRQGGRLEVCKADEGDQGQWLLHLQREAQRARSEV